MIAEQKKQRLFLQAINKSREEATAFNGHWGKEKLQKQMFSLQRWD